MKQFSIATRNLLQWHQWTATGQQITRKPELIIVEGSEYSATELNENGELRLWGLSKHRTCELTTEKNLTWRNCKQFASGLLQVKNF